jgi:tetratricopeptide (TPR) repeat protein
MVALVVGVAPASAQKGQKRNDPSAADMVKARQLYQNARDRKQEADELAARGEADSARRAYGLAAKDYLEAYRLSKLPAFLYNLGSIYRLRGDRQWAIRCYRAFLVSEPEDEKDIQDALTFINDLKRELRASPRDSQGDLALEPVGVCIEPDEPVAGEVEPAAATAAVTPEMPGGADDPGKPGEHGASRPGRGYRVAFWASAGATAVSAAVSGVTLYQVYGPLVDDKQRTIDVYVSRGYQPLNTEEACGDADSRLAAADADERMALDDVVSACNTGKSRATLSNIFQGVTVVGLVATGFFLYKGYLSKSRAGESRAGESRAGAARVTPILGPRAVGAEFTLRF